MSSRPRPSSSLPKPPTTLASTAVIADTVTVTGTHRVIVGSDVIIHPRAKLNSTFCPITVRTGCIISEKAVIGLLEAYTAPAAVSNSSDPPANSPSTTAVTDDKPHDITSDPMSAADDSLAYDIVLEPNVVIEPAAIVEARSIGEGSVLEAGCRVGAGAVIGRYCKVTPLCTVRPGEVLKDFTIVYGNGQRRREKPGLEGLRAKTHLKEIEVLRRLIPSNLAKFQSG